MTQNEKDLLLKDLCARVPYGVKIYLEDAPNTTLIGVVDEGLVLHNNENDYTYNIHWKVEYTKPYLFPLSSMTEEQRCEYHNHCDVGLTEWGNELYYDCAESFDWLNAHYFDYRDLIEKGLAIDATNLNIY